MGQLHQKLLKFIAQIATCSNFCHCSKLDFHTNQVTQIVDSRLYKISGCSQGIDNFLIHGVRAWDIARDSRSKDNSVLTQCAYSYLLHGRR
jgi:hypothetical protein